jgi:RNA polymerase primary sigma factor
LPLNQVGSLSKISKAFSKLEQEYEREPSPEELADTLETTVEKISDTLSNSGRHVSMDAPFVQGEENTLLDVLENRDPNTDNSLIDESLSEEIKRSLATLTDREREIIVLFFGLGSNQPLSLEEIGEQFSLTRERVRQIKDKALQRLRHASRSRILKSYLG